MDVIKAKGIASRVIIQSFDPRTLVIVHRDYPSQVTALLVGNKESFEKNVAILPWTVNEEADMKAMVDLGVDGIISDYPDRLVKLFGSYQQ
jgi:glycerophosphoryl diester phosphodiesterase